MTAPTENSPIQHFRRLLAGLEARGRVRHVSRPVDTSQQLVAVLRQVQRATNEPLVFAHPLGSSASVAGNVLCDRGVVATALGVGEADLLRTMVARESETKALKGVIAAPVHDNIRKGADIDVSRDLPQIIHFAGDAGAYIAAAVVIARHPETGGYNASWHRVQIVGGDRLRVRILPQQHLAQYQAMAERAGRGLPVAVVIGAPPALMLSAASKLAFEADELAVAGGFQDTSLRVASGRTVPLLVPAEAEYVIEGELLPNVREEEGPFGDAADGCAPPGAGHVMRVSAITHRDDPVFHAILPGSPEARTLLGVPLQAFVYRAASALGRVRDVGTPGHALGCVVSLEKESDEQARAVMRAVLEAYSWMKLVVVVDADVDPHDADAVLRAIQMRHSPETGILQLPASENAAGATIGAVPGGKLGIDATVPLSLRSAFRPREASAAGEIRLEDFLDPAPTATAS